MRLTVDPAVLGCSPECPSKAQSSMQQSIAGTFPGQGHGGRGEGEAGHPTTAPRRVARGRGDRWAESGEQATPPPRAPCPPSWNCTGLQAASSALTPCRHVGGGGELTETALAPGPSAVPRGHSRLCTLTAVPTGGVSAVLLGRRRGESGLRTKALAWCSAFSCLGLQWPRAGTRPGRNGEKWARGVPGGGEFDGEQRPGIGEILPDAVTHGEESKSNGGL